MHVKKSAGRVRKLCARLAPGPLRHCPVMARTTREHGPPRVYQYSTVESKGMYDYRARMVFKRELMSFSIRPRSMNRRRINDQRTRSCFSRQLGVFIRLCNIMRSHVACWGNHAYCAVQITFTIPSTVHNTAKLFAYISVSALIVRSPCKSSPFVDLIINYRAQFDALASELMNNFL